MQKKKDKFFDKFVKKDYNNELEKVLEKKYFDEDAKNLLLNILYKVEIAYKDYEKVKPYVETKEEFINSIIEIIRNNCEDIKIVKINSKEAEILGNKTFLVEKDKKRIICYPIERKLLYCISKIGKNKKIIKNNYYMLDRTLSNFINIGNNINTVEPMRDFNGYSWTTISKEIESIYHNIAYQNIRILVGEKFLNNWIKNSEYIIDYLESFKNNLEEKYGQSEQNEFTNILEKLSVLLSIKFDAKIKNELKKEKKEVESRLEEIQDNKKFIQKLTNEKRDLTKEIKEIDETINNKNMLQQEYEKRNEFLPLQQKIFSIKILSKMMSDERNGKIKRLEQLNDLLNPQKFIEYKNKLEEKEKYLKLIETKDIEKEIKELIINLQKVFLSCYKTKIKTVETKQELIKLIYEFRYYYLLPFNEQKTIGQIEEIFNIIKDVESLIIEKTHELKVIEIFSKDKDLDYQILRNIFHIRIINLEDLYIKLMKEKDNYYIQLFDENVFEEKIQIENKDNLNKKSIEFKINKKIKIFN